jgi:hypothetical protein
MALYNIYPGRVDRIDSDHCGRIPLDVSSPGHASTILRWRSSTDWTRKRLTEIKGKMKSCFCKCTAGGTWALAPGGFHTTNGVMIVHPASGKLQFLRCDCAWLRHGIRAWRSLEERHIWAPTVRQMKTCSSNAHLRPGGRVEDGRSAKQTPSNRALSDLVVKCDQAKERHVARRAVTERQICMIGRPHLVSAIVFPCMHGFSRSTFALLPPPRIRHGGSRPLRSSEEADERWWESEEDGSG